MGAPMANYAAAKRVGDFVFMSGVVAVDPARRQAVASYDDLPPIARDELRTLGAFRADVSGAGPTVYGLFHHRQAADAARRRLRSRGRTWLTAPAWYG